MPTTQPKLPISVLILAPSVASLSPRQKTLLERAVRSAEFASEVKVIEQFEPILDFATARNQALTMAKHDWIFFLDSDEWFAANAAEAIAVLLSEKHIAGISIRRIDVFHDKTLQYGETGRHYLLRFMRKDKSCFIRPVHETAEVIGLVKNNDLTIWHEAHYDINDFFQSIVRYSELEASWRATHLPKTPASLVVIQLLCYPPGKFLLNYVFKGGWLDGWHGLVYAYMMSLHSLFVRIFWLEKQFEFKKINE